MQHVWLNHDTYLVDVDVVAGAATSTTTTTAGVASTATATVTQTHPGHGLLAGDDASSAVHLVGIAQQSMTSAAAGETIHATANHPWLTADRGWVLAGDLRPGEAVVTVDGATSTVTWVHVVPGQADYYNLTVAKDHTYAVGDVQSVVHNCTGGETGSRGPTGARNGPPAVPPPYDGATTEGWLVTNEGDIVPLKSGESQLPNYASAGHVEGKAALEIRARGSSGGAVWHNNPSGTCHYCNTQIPTLLPEGSTLTVVPPEGASAPNRFWYDQPTQYTGNARTPNGM